MRSNRVFSVVVLICGLVQSARADFETPTAITHASVVPTAGELLEDATVVIENGRIVAVGTNVQIPPHARILNGTGLYVYPGFIDAASQAGISAKEPDANARKRIEDEYPDVREGPQSATVQAHRRLIHPHWRAFELFDPDKAELDNIRKAGFTTMLVSAEPAIFAGTSAVINTGDEPLRRMVLDEDFAQLSAFVTSRSNDDHRYPVTTMGAIAAFRQVMLDSQWQRELLDWSQRNPTGEAAPKDDDLEALWKIADGQLPVVFVANSENEIHRALDVAAEFNLKPIIAGGAEAWRVTERLKREDVPVILSLRWPESPLKKYEKLRKNKKKDRGKRQDDSATPEEDEPDPRADLKPVFDDEWEEQVFDSQGYIDERVRLWREHVDNALRLHEAGVRFAFGSFELNAPKDVLKQVRQVIERGLPEDQAVAALTTNAADILGINAQTGRISEGQLANLVIFDKPFADEKAKIELVFVQGQRFDYSGAGAGKDRPGRRRGQEEQPEEAAEESGVAVDDQPDDQDAEEQEDVRIADRSAEDEEEEEDTVVPGAPTFAVETDPMRQPAFQTEGNLLIKNANLLRITGQDVQGGDLLIRDGKIAEIGENLSAPEGVRTIDLSGYFVMPGMFDPHSHMCSDGGLNESSLSVTCEVRVNDVVDHRDVGAYRALAGGVTTIHTMHGSANTIGGQNAILRLKYGRPVAEWRFPNAQRTVKFALGENVKQANFGNRGSRFPNSRMGVEAVLRRTFDEAQRYQQEYVVFERDQAAGLDPRPLRRDLRLEALTEILNGDIWINCHCYRADEVLRLLDVAEDYGVRVALLHHILEGYKIIPEIQRHGCGAATFSDWWAYKLEAYDAIPYNAARMLQGGALAMLKSDSAEVVRHLNLEAAKSLHYGGLSANDALKLVTLNPAKNFALDQYIGSLEEGKFADIAVFDGHPLDTFSKNVLTLIDGEVYFQHPDLNVSAPAKPRSPRHLSVARAALPIGASDAGNYWVTGATLHPITGPVVEDGVVAIQDGRITWIGSGSGRRPPAASTIVDATDLHVYPGLINAGTSLGLTEIGSVRGSVDASEIGSFQSDLLAVSAYNPHSAMINVTRAEGVTTAVVLPGRGPVAGQAGVVHLTGWTMPEAVFRDRVALAIDVPSLPVEYPSLLSAEQKKRSAERRKNFATNLKELEDFFREAQHYAKVKALAEHDHPELQPELDRRFEVMVPFLEGTRPVLLQANSYKEIKEALVFADRYDLEPIIYGGREAWKLAGELAERNVDVIIQGSMAYSRDRFEPWDSVYRNAAVLDQAGVRFCFSTGGAALARQLGVQAGMAVAHGLSEQSALEAVTIRAAQILGLDDELGSLEPSKVADLIITTDSPLQASNNVVAEFIRGMPVELTSRHTELDAKFLSRPQPTLPPEKQLKGPPPMRFVNN